MAGWTGLEPATFCVTGRRSNQLSYHPVKRERTRNVGSTKVESSVVLADFSPPNFPATADRNSLIFTAFHHAETACHLRGDPTVPARRSRRKQWRGGRDSNPGPTV